MHALLQARRALRPDGVLIDLRPSSVHRRVGIETAGRIRPLGVMRESFHYERASDRAVATVVRRGLLRGVAKRRFPCTRTMDTLAEFEEWLAESADLGFWPPHPWLVRRIATALERRVRTKIVVRGPMDLCVLRKSER